MTAIDLYAEAGDFLADIGKEGLDDGDQQRCTARRRAPAVSIRMAVFQVELACAAGRQHAAAFDQGLLGQQHAPHV
ncbi:hypothetical protein TI06_23615, partial [Vibrio vulnificus]